MIENYKKYLNMVTEKINGFFEKQKPYIFCHKGCAKCCKNAQFPFTEIEFRYLMNGYNKLSQETKSVILKNIKNTIQDKKSSNKKPYTYNCPFLINDSCSVYEYRGIICRTFGLLTLGKEDKDTQIPFCALEGLNYSNVYEKETQMISKKKFQNLGIDIEPTYFHVAYDFLTEPEFGKGYGFEFGKTKALIDWFE